MGTRNVIRPALLIAVLLGAPTVAVAQDPTHAWRSVEVWGGIANGSPRWGVLGQVPGMNFGVMGVRVVRPLGDPSPQATRVTAFTIDLIPLAMTSPPYRSLRGTGVPCAKGRLCVAPQLLEIQGFPAGSAYGFGLSPVGLTTRWRARSSASPWVGASAGALYFDRRIPTSQGARFNFTAALEAGVRFGAPGTRGIGIFYRLHHISNASTARENPGLASHVFGIGIHDPR